MTQTRRAAGFGLCAAAALALAPGAARSAEPIKIGAIVATSGNDTAQGAELTNGMRLAIEQFGPSVNGRDIRLLVEDDTSNPNVGLQKARKLIQSDGVDIIAGIQLSSAALAISPVVSAARVPTVLSLSAANALTGEKCSPWVFRASYANSQLAEPLGKWAFEKGYKSVYILGSDFVTPRELASDFRKTFEKAGGKVAGEAFSPFGKTQDFGPYLSQVRAAAPDALLAIYFGAEAILFTKQYESFGMKDKLPMIATLGTTPVMLRQAQGDSSVGVISSLNYIPELDTPENKAFQASYKAKFGSTASEFGVMGFDSMRFAIEGLKKVNGATDDRAALARAISQVSFKGPRGPMTMDPKTNHVSQNIYIAKAVKTDGEVGFELLDTITNVTTDSTACNMPPLK
ncbi:MAG: transporter [Hyphomicrobiales bacterium]|nr:transporter [Hyphomicrobiales bacterium]